MKLSLDNIIKSAKRVKRLPRFIATHAFVGFLLFLAIACLVGGLIYYKYDILARNSERKTATAPLRFDEKTYGSILEQWKTREEKLQNTETRSYPDPFYPPDTQQ